MASKPTTFSQSDARRIQAAVKNFEQRKGFEGRNSTQVGSRRDLWLKIKSKDVSDWSEGQLVYTADVYITPFDEDAFKENVDVIASGEMSAEDDFICQPIPNKTFVKAVDFIQKSGEEEGSGKWYYIAEWYGSDFFAVKINKTGGKTAQGVARRHIHIPSNASTILRSR